MSFFYLKEFIRETYLIWSFVCLMVVGCFVVKGYDDKNQIKRQQFHIYHGSLNEETLKVDGTVQKESQAPKSLYAKYALLMDASNGRVLFEKQGYEQVPMASTTKIMTLLVTLENANLEDVVTVSKYASTMPDVQLNIREGEQYILSDLLYSLMLESHNDVAVAIAEHVGGSVEGFAAMMNEKAKELGAYNTNFVTPNGLDADGHYTTARDLALISSYAIQNENFLKIIQTPTHNFHEQTKGRSFTVNNKDQFLKLYKGALGIKTGFTGDAGYCFVGAVERDGKKFVSVVLACGWPPNKSYKWKDTTKLMDYGVKYYHMKELVKPGTAFQKINVLDAIEGSTITPYVNESLSLLVRDDEQVSYDIKLPTQISAPVKKNQTVGEMIIYLNDEKYKVLPLYSQEERSKITFGYILKKLCYQYFLVFTD